MADNKKIEQFNDELNKVSDRIANMGDALGESLVKNLSKAVVEARNLSKNLQDSKSITSQLNKVMDDNEALITQLNAAQISYNKAVQSGTDKEKLNKKIKLDQLKATLSINQGIEDQLRILSQISKENKKQINVLEITKKKIEDINLKYLSLTAIFKLLLDAALRFNAISVKTGKDLGYGANQADRVAYNLKDIAQSSTNANVTLKSLGEAMNDLNTATGGVAEYSKDTLETQVMLTKQFGLTGEEAAGIYKFSVLTGKSSKIVNEEMAAAFANTRNSVKGSANFKTTMAEAAKVSGQLAANLKNSPTLITKAIVQAQILGTTLEQTKNQGEALLNFESSLENELKAELLTGQQMNLERARAFALQGDMVGVMKELNNQGMTLEKFNNMNVIAQKSYAEALGLSADALSDQLRKQKIAQEQGKSLAEITAEEAVEAEKRQAIQEKFNVAIEKLQDLLGNLIAGPLGQFLDIITSILSNTFILNTILGGVLFSNILKLVKFARLLKIEEIGIAIGKAWSAAMSGPQSILTGGIAGIAIAGGLTAAILAAVNSSKSMNDGVMSPSGKILYSGSEGAIKLNDNDTVIAGTNLGGGKGESISPTIDLTPMIAAINQVKASIDRLHAKDTTINMDGKQVGTTLTQGSYKVA